jgi:hypothetical protein
MRVTLTANEIVQFRTRANSQLFDKMAEGVGGVHGASPSAECLYWTKIKVEYHTRSIILGAPESNLDPILDEAVARIGAA